MTQIRNGYRNLNTKYAMHKNFLFGIQIIWIQTFNTINLINY